MDFVLIDTWWNVNFCFYVGDGTDPIVLIDTWWNVNISKLEPDKDDHNGFNRYMVECECFPYRNIGIQSKVLIDTWWNVNLFPCLSG